jgi:hypothetical protein
VDHGWVVWAEVVFVLLFTIEMLIKWGAAGIRPYFKSKMNTLDFVIVAVAWASGCVYVFVSEQEAQGLLAFRLLRVLRVTKLLFHTKYLRDLLELAFASAST